MALDLAWNSLDRAAWEALFEAAGRTALLQSWAWGEAKAAGEGWRPHRGVLTEAGTPVGLVQVLEKPIAGLARVARLNRGPVWLVPAAPIRVVEALALIGRRWRWWRGGALFLAPELAADQAGALAPLGLRKRSAPAWGSAWLDLSEPAEALRKRLDGKWRNMLVGAEKAGLAVEVSAAPALLDWLLARYETLMRDKAFTGTPPALIRQLAERAWRPDDLLVLRALTPDGEAVGGILLVRHGACATYLVGWTGEDGRRFKANNFLLWQAVTTLAERGCRWFDLGGIDEVLTPSIAAFKRGMKGEDYRLAGEYLML